MHRIPCVSPSSPTGTKARHELVQAQFPPSYTRQKSAKKIQLYEWNDPACEVLHLSMNTDICRILVRRQTCRISGTHHRCELHTIRMHSLGHARSSKKLPRIEPVNRESESGSVSRNRRSIYIGPEWDDTNAAIREFPYTVQGEHSVDTTS